jgi:hypothetical protein
VLGATKVLLKKVNYSIAEYVGGRIRIVYLKEGNFEQHLGLFE